jgi:hypothetical protein
MQHLSVAHGEALTRSQLLAPTRRNRTVTVREPFTCPLCHCCPNDVASRITEKQYERLSTHIARHLKALAFLSLSYLDYDEDISGSSETGNQSAQKDGAECSETSRCEPNDESFNDVPPTVDLENAVDDQISVEPPELNNPITWHNVLLKAYPGRDEALEKFAAAMKTGIEKETDRPSRIAPIGKSRVSVS